MRSQAEDRHQEKSLGTKKAYQSPRMTNYGDLRRLTLDNKGGRRNDGDPGMAATKR